MYLKKKELCTKSAISKRKVNMERGFSIHTLREKESPSSSISSLEDNRYNDFINIKSRLKMHGYNEMMRYVSENILYLLSSAVDKKPRALQTITDKDFLIAMDIANLDLSREYINRFNRVYRAYIINPSKNAIYNQESADMLYKIALKLNKRLVEILESINLQEKDALWLVVNRYSSTDERRNIRRMVRAMQHMSPRLMTEQMVVNIFAKTFNDQLTNLFCAVMTDRFDYFDSKDEEYVYSTVSNALLDILKTMDIDEIKDILLEYFDELQKSGVNGRFSIEAINGSDYGEILNAIDEIKDMGMRVF